MKYVNQEELTLESAKIIPSHTLSFAENAIYVAEAIEENYNALFESIGINELAVYESTGSQIVYEGVNLKELKDKAVNFIKKMWASIKAGFEKVLAKFKMMNAEARKQMTGKLSASDIDNIADDKKFGKVHEFSGEPANYYDNAKKYLDEIKADLAANNGMDNAKENIKQTIDEVSKNACSKVSGIDGVESAGDMVAKIKESLLGSEVEVDKSWLKSNLNKVIDIVINGKSTEDISKAYKDMKKYCDDCITDLKKMDENNANMLNKSLSAMKNVAVCMNQANNAAMDVYNRRFVEYKNVFVKAYVAAGKMAKTKAATQESVIATQQDMIEEAFAW